jgi:hypothetical protein
MTDYVFKYPSKTINGNVVVMPLEQWAGLTLLPADLVTFRAAQVRQNAIAKAAIAANTIAIATDAIGQTLTTDIEVPASDAEWETFNNQYLADSTLTWPA